MRRLIVFVAVAWLAALAAPAAYAQVGQPLPNAPPQAAVLAMVRSTLLAVDQANKTGNYTVLRDLCSPQFREANTAARLGQVFGVLPAQGVDLLAVAIAEPMLAQAPSITPDRMLRVVGMFQIAPRAVTFEILYEPVGGQWRVYSLAILPS